MRRHPEWPSIHSFICLKRPPDGNLDRFFGALEALLDHVSINQQILYLSGDMNIDMKCVSAAQIEFMTLLDSYGFINLIEVPTRITPSTATTLDLVITNATKYGSNAGTVLSDVSDHLPVFSFITVSPFYHSSELGPTFYQRVNINTLEHFRTAIRAISWDDVLSLQDADSAYDALMLKVKSAYAKCFPIICYRKRKNKKPWITPELVRKIKAKDKLYAKFIKSRDSAKLCTYKKYRNRLNRELKNAKREYFCNLFSFTSGKSARDQWSQLNQVLNLSSRVPVTSIVKDCYKITGKELCNEFNQFFIDVTKNLCSPPDTPGDYTCQAPGVRESLYLFPTSENEVIATFTSLRYNKAKDKDGFQIKPFIYVIDLLAPVLTHIYNLLCSTGVFPKQMQVAKVVVIHKGGPTSDLSNYRPISILPVLSKGLEKIIYHRINSFLTKHAVLSDNQFGFRRNRSGEMALAQQKEIIINAFEEKHLVLGIYVDFSKAFDLLNHNVLIYKLNHYGIRGVSLSLLHTYLMHRNQMV